jgi:hypothetical protein
VEVIASKWDGKLETKIERLYDEVLTLKMAIEEAIIKGQKASGAPIDIPESDMAFYDEFDPINANGGPGLVGWIDDL